MSSERNNINFRRICKHLQLKAADVVRICDVGGLEVSKSQADGWQRMSFDERGRYRKMTNAEFDLFCRGLERIDTVIS